MPLSSVFSWSISGTLAIPEWSGHMNKLPTRREPSREPEIEATATWRELGERVRDVMKDFIKEGKDLERDLEPRLLPALKRLKTEIEKLIAKLEERAGKQG